jgi:hypothetical protein
MTHLHTTRTRKALLAALTLLTAAVMGLGWATQTPSIAGSAGASSKVTRESSVAGSAGDKSKAGRESSVAGSAGERSKTAGRESA